MPLLSIESLREREREIEREREGEKERKGQIVKSRENHPAKIVYQDEPINRMLPRYIYRHFSVYLQLSSTQKYNSLSP